METKERKQAVSSLEKEAERLRKELEPVTAKQKDLEAIQAMIKYLNDSSVQLETLSALHQEPYPMEANYPEKILYVLKQKGECLNKDIVAFIKEAEGLSSKEASTLSLTIGKAASRLVLDKKIKAVKQGIANKYSLP